MGMARVNIRVPDEDLERWKERAESAGLSLSDWIRFRCSPRAAEENAASNRVSDVPSGPAVREDEGREPVSAGAVPRTAKASTAKRLREEIPELKPAAEVPEEETRSPLSRLPVVGEQIKGKASAKTCVHGTAKGYRCWQCGGLAHV